MENRTKKDRNTEAVKLGKAIKNGYSGLKVAVGRDLTRDDVDLLQKAIEIQEKRGSGELEIGFF